MADKALRGYLINLEAAKADGNDLRADAGQGGVYTDRLIFQYNPETLEHEVGVTWAAVVVPGFSHRRLQWGGGGAQTWKLTLKMRWGTGAAEGDAALTFVRDSARFLEGLTRPSHRSDGSLGAGPPKALFVFGRAVSAEVVVQPFKVKYGPLFDPETLLPLEASIDLTLEEQVEESEGIEAFRGDAPHGAYRGR